MATIEALHNEVGYAQHEAALKSEIPSLYRTLQAAQSKARRDPAFLPSYRKLLTQALLKLREGKGGKETGPTVDQILSDAKAFWAFYQEQAEVLGVSQKEGSRFPQVHQAWIEKNLPRHWERFSRAIALTVETGSPRSYESARQVAVDMLKAYIEGRE